MADENVTNQNNDTETQANNPYDALFKEVMTELFGGLQIPIKTEQEVSRKPRTIDAVITCTPKDIEKAKRETPFDFLSENNIIAFKSIADQLTVWEYHKIRARAHFYIAENKLAASNTIICAVCSSEPRKLLHQSRFPHLRKWVGLKSPSARRFLAKELQSRRICQSDLSGGAELFSQGAEDRTSRRTR